MNNRCIEDKNYPNPPLDKVRPVRISCLDSYDNKVKAEVGRIRPAKTNDEDMVISCFEMYKRRNTTNSGDPSRVGVDERYNTFVHALNNSYNSERIQIVEKTEIHPHYTDEFLSLITPDEKRGINNVCIPFEIMPDVGKLIHWQRTESYWLITSRDDTEKAYFKGTIEKCNYVLTWRDEKGNIYKQRVKMQGPVETKFKNEVLGDFIGGKANETNSIWMARTENTKHLNRYDKLIMNGKGYEITVVNDVDSIIKINLIEGYVNPEEDLLIAGEEISEGQIVIDYKVYSTIDGVAELSMKPFEFKTVLYKNGIIENAMVTIKVSSNATYSNGMIYPLEPGELTIDVCYSGYPVDKTYKVLLVENEVQTIYYEILGQDTIDMYSTVAYQLGKNVDGNIEILDANQLQIASEDASKVSITKSNISVSVSPKKIGTFTMYAIINGEKVEKKIKIVNPW